jgi:hypothetical protein
VLPRVRYGTACLLIWDTVGSVPCSDEWKFGVVTRQAQKVQEGHGTATTPGNLSIAMVLRLP